jgi:DNA-binding GntR family transcriptional regulator
MVDGRALATSELSSETVYSTLRGRIVTCELVPGQWLAERRSAIDLGLGLSPVRAALTRLARDGLVQVVPRKGYRVTPLSEKSVDDLFTTWTLLGPELAALGISRADPEQAAELRQLMVDGNTVLAGPLDRDRVVEFIGITERVFDLFAAASHNDRLVEVYRSLAGEMWRVLTLVLITADSARTFLAAGVTWDSTIDRRDALMATRITRDVTVASHTAAMRVLPHWPTTGDGVVVALRR